MQGIFAIGYIDTLDTSIQTLKKNIKNIELQLHNRRIHCINVSTARLVHINTGKSLDTELDTAWIHMYPDRVYKEK